MSKRTFSIFLIVFVLAVALLPQVVAADNNAPVNLTFAKQIAGDGVWQGTVGGDVQGQLTTVLTGLRVSGPIWHVEFDWIIDADDDAYDFTARLSGILNTRTGSVVMNGAVVEGWLLGARVHEEGQLVDPATLGFEGSIRLMPATAD
jgi:opacity protein-like surface antigen